VLFRPFLNELEDARSWGHRSHGLRHHASQGVRKGSASGQNGHLLAVTILGQRSAPPAQQATEVSARRHRTSRRPGAGNGISVNDHSTPAI
jgi:hypothetical protein